eukprot:scaffold67728_cov28-Tisochrysis_lutea.AAC.4
MARAPRGGKPLAAPRPSSHVKRTVRPATPRESRAESGHASMTRGPPVVSSATAAERSVHSAGRGDRYEAVGGGGEEEIGLNVFGTNGGSARGRPAV